MLFGFHNAGDCKKVKVIRNEHQLSICGNNWRPFVANCWIKCNTWQNIIFIQEVSLEVSQRNIVGVYLGVIFLTNKSYYQIQE